jgi:hypothetical protein
MIWLNAGSLARVNKGNLFAMLEILERLLRLWACPHERVAGAERLTASPRPSASAGRASTGCWKLSSKGGGPLQAARGILVRVVDAVDRSFRRCVSQILLVIVPE